MIWILLASGLIVIGFTLYGITLIDQIGEHYKEKPDRYYRKKLRRKYD